MAQQNSCISVQSRLFESVLESLCNARSTISDNGVEELSHHEERQQALLELLGTRALDRFDEGRLLSLSNAAKFFRVSELIYQRRREFTGILDCYCLDQARQSLVFAYIRQIIASRDASVEEKGRLRQAVLSRLEELICIDAKKTTKLVTTNLGIELAQAVNQVVRCCNNGATFDFLQCLFETTECWNGGPADDDGQFDASVYERYVELLCQRTMVEDVTAFLRSHDGQRPAKMLEICRRFHVSEAVVVLLEKSGDVSGAFDEAVRALRAKLSIMVRFDDLDSDQLEQLKAVRDVVESVISLLNRNSQQLEEVQLRRLWFTLFDLLIENYNRLIGCRMDSSRDDGGGGTSSWIAASSPFTQCGWSSVRGEYQSVLQHAVSCMVSCVPFTAVLDHIVELGADDGIASCFGNIRDLLTSVMDACRYQRSLYTTCARTVQKDVNGAIGGLAAAARSPISPHLDTCSACRRVLSDASRTDEVGVVCFQCGHAFHHLCLGGSVGAGKDVEECRPHMERRQRCAVCCRSRTRSTLPYGRSRVVDLQGQSDGDKVSDVIETPVYLETVEAVRQLRRSQRTASRLEVLSELRQLEQAKTVRSPNVWSGAGTPVGNVGAFHGDRFSLKLAPPPAQ